MKKVFAVIMMCVALQLKAQQVPHVYNQFFMNPYIYNPAYVGVEGHSVLFLMYKNNWSKVDGAPVEMHANFHVPLKGGMAFGAMAYNEMNGPLTTSGGKVTGGYLVNIDRTHFLRFGLSIGAGNTMLDQSKLETNDPAIFGLAQSSSFLIGDLGATYHFGHFNVGISLPTLFNPSLSISQIEGLAPVRFKPTDNVMFKMNYRGHINDDIAIEPHAIYRYNKYFPDQYEATVILHIYHLLWAGATYRQDAGAAGLLGFKIKEILGIGYAYELGNSQYGSNLGGSHEIHIGYHIGAKKDHAEHVSSFIKSHRLSAEQRAKQAELERQQKLQELRESREAAAQKPQEDALGILGATPVDQQEEEKPSPKTNWSYEKENNLVERVNEFGEVEKGVKLDRVNEQGEKEVVFSWLPPPPPGVTSETYEIANPDEPLKERKRPDGTTEVGVKWIRTLDDGTKEILVIWDPVLSETEAGEIDHEPSQTMGLGDAKIVITAKPVLPTKTVEVPVTQVNPDPIDETPVIEEQPEPEIVETQPEPVEEEQAITSPTVLEPPVDNTTPEPVQVKRGNHMLELDPGNYVVAGAFAEFQHAEDQSDILFNRGFHDTKVGYLTAKGYYYVVIFQSNSTKSAYQMRNRVKSMAGLSDVWVLKVNE